MISASKTLHQISWPILKKNIDICENKRSNSLGILFAVEKDLPESDSDFFKLLFNKNIKSTYFKSMAHKAFLSLSPIAKDSPAYEEKLLENDIILAINKESTSNFRKKLKKALLSSS